METALPWADILGTEREGLISMLVDDVHGGALSEPVLLRFVLLLLVAGASGASASRVRNPDRAMSILLLPWCAASVH